VTDRTINNTLITMMVTGKTGRLKEFLNGINIVAFPAIGNPGHLIGGTGVSPVVATFYGEHRYHGRDGHAT
jgi:hypothetical protein